MSATSSSSTDASRAAGAERPPRASATLVLVRDSANGLQVLLGQRAERGDQNSGAWVFPGGLVDAADGRADACCAGLDDAAASRMLGLPAGGLAYFVAAARECFEEAGLLFARPSADGTPGAPLVADNVALDHWRTPLHRSERGIDELCREAGLLLALDRLAYLSHWITPLARPKRFDTRFFVAEAPAGQTATPDGHETTELAWLAPADALANGEALKLMTPTRATLELLARHADVAALMAWARAPREVPTTLPRFGIGREGGRPVLPAEPAYAEIGRLDSDGHGKVSYELVPGRAVRLSSRVVRVTANNGSMMTGPGTNSYFVGGGELNEWALIDPGPLLDDHVQALIAAAPGPVRWIFATHTHKDHSPATPALQRATGAAVHGQVAANRQWQDASFVPDVVLRGGERIVLSAPGVADAATTTLRVIHTPGHASNHLCYLLEEEKTLFTGDHVMQLSTVVINPPDGDMSAYLSSLRALLAEDLEWLAPGHGFLMERPQRAIEGIIAHRLKREAKVLAALQAIGPAHPDELLARIYDDVPQRLHEMALRSLAAHLLKLRADGVARETDGRWAAALPA